MVGGIIPTILVTQTPVNLFAKKKSLLPVKWIMTKIQKYKWLHREKRFNKDATVLLSFKPKNGFPIYCSFCRIKMFKGYNILELHSLLKLSKQRYEIKACESGRHVYVIPLYCSFPETNKTLYTETQNERKLSYKP